MCSHTVLVACSILTVKGKKRSKRKNIIVNIIYIVECRNILEGIICKLIRLCNMLLLRNLDHIVVLFHALFKLQRLA